MRSEIVIVLYHDISEDQHALAKQLRVSISPELFEKHMWYFCKNFDFISADDLLAGNLPRKALLITFDDAYRSVLYAGGPILKAFNAPSLFFINPATVVSNTVPVDNVISFATEELGVKEILSLLKVEAGDILSASQLIAELVSKWTLAEVEEAKRRIFAALGTSESYVYETSKIFLSPNEITALAEYRIDVGNHSMGHAFFRGLSMVELDTEIGASRAILERMSGQSVTCLSIPYGNESDATEPALTVARATGHHAIFLIHARSNRFRPASDIYYRISLQNTRLESLPRKLRVEPVLRSLRNWMR